MELKKLKARLATAKRGHKLLKDKNDELVRRFSVLIRENKRLRDKVEQAVSSSLAQFAIARSFMSKSEVGLNFAMPSTSLELDCSTTTVMNLTVPKLELKENRSANKYPYALIATVGNTSWGAPYMIHGNKTNAVFVDGHVATLAKEEFNNDGANALFCITNYGARGVCGRRFYKVINANGVVE